MANRSNDGFGSVIAILVGIAVLFLLYRWLQGGGLNTLPGGVYAQSGSSISQNPISSLLSKFTGGSSSNPVPANYSNYSNAANPLTLALANIGTYSGFGANTPNPQLGESSLSDYEPDLAAQSGLSDYQIPLLG